MFFSIQSIADIQHGFYINLDSRPDRKVNVEKQLALVGLDSAIQRFPAIRLPNGAVGCSMSHLKCLQIARANGWPHVFICEDDIQFTKPSVFCDQLNGFLSANKEWDVLLLAGNNMPPYREHDTFSVQVTHCQTTTGYIVQQQYYETLIENIKEGLQQLIREPHRHVFFAIDKYWLHLQKRDRWYLIVPLTVVQRVDYSDIERRMTNYTQVMTDLDKNFLMNSLNRAKKMTFQK